MEPSVIDRNLKKAALCAALLGALAPVAAQAQQAQGDPLYRYQWHLMNYGQAVLGDTRPTFSVDMGIDDLHTYNIRGKGVVVSVIDQGMEIAHPDLAANMVPNGSWHFGNDTHDPTPLRADHAHGTAVGGIIGAVGWNGIGVRGVAPSARLKSFNYLSHGLFFGPSLEDVWWDHPLLADVQVSNNSWGSFADTTPTVVSELEIAARERAMSATRGGLGTVYVKSAGNGFSNWPRSGGLGINTCSTAVSGLGVGCDQSIWDDRNNLFNVMTIAAVNAAGRRSNYSTPGSSLWVSGLGGEYGQQRAHSTLTNPLNFDPAIVTTDLSGCVRGYNSDAAPRNALDSSNSTIDNTCNYTGRMNGTSAAAPNVSGVVALMLQANPRLTYRDVKYILATTARQVDPQQAEVRDANGTLLSQGWITNAAGRRFSNWYGFGLADATFAVTRASNFKSLPALVDSGWERANLATPVAIGSADAPAQAVVRIDDNIRNIEAVQIGLTTTYGLNGGWGLGQAVANPIRVTLTSPSGTQAFVLPARAGFGNRVVNIPFAAVNAFLDEPATGDWTVEVADVGLAAGAPSAGNLTSFKIRILGH